MVLWWEVHKLDLKMTSWNGKPLVITQTTNVCYVRMNWTGSFFMINLLGTSSFICFIKTTTAVSTSSPYNDFLETASDILRIQMLCVI